MIRLSLLLVVLGAAFSCRAETLLVIGDSISAGYGLGQINQGWVALVQEDLKPRGVEVVNASISGDTTLGGLNRIDELLGRVKPGWVIIELGGNDGLRGLTPVQMESNLIAMIEKSRAAKARVLLLGMRIPPNYGKRYAELFEQVYRRVAEKTRVALVPFLLEGVGGIDGMIQADGIHPNERAQPIIAEQVIKAVVPMLRDSR
ncbi:MAG: arylesterase [Methylococcus sp.]